MKKENKKLETNIENKVKGENPMQEIVMEKVVLSVGGIADNLEKGYKLLKMLTGRNPAKMMSRKRIPALGVRPGLEIGAVVTVRKNLHDFLSKMLTTVDNRLRRKQISEN